MRRSVLRWLLQRGKHPQQRISAPLSPYTAMIAEEWRRRTVFDADMEEDPTMCLPRLGRDTAHITRIIDQGATMPVWDDERRTFTMETARIKV